MSQIYKVEDQDLGNRVCVLKELLISNFLPKDQQVIIKSFQREAALLARLNHPNLPRATDYFIENNNFYLVVDYIMGDNLEEIRTTRRCSEEEVIKWSLTILDILEYLHNQQPPIIYRDLKPANIMLDIRGNIKLVDFGIAREFDPAFTNQQTNIGTCGYAPPEQYQGKAQPRSDLYSLGVVMHYSLSGLDPQAFNLQPIESLVKNINPQLATVIQTATDMRINYRYSNATCMKLALNSIINNSQPANLGITYDQVIIDNLQAIYYQEDYDRYKPILLKAINFFKNGFEKKCLEEMYNLKYQYYGDSADKHLLLFYSFALIFAKLEWWLELENALLAIIERHPDFSASYELLANYQIYIDQMKAELAEEKRKKQEERQLARQEEEEEMKKKREAEEKEAERLAEDKRKKLAEEKQKKKEAWENRKKQFFTFFTRFLKK